MIWVIVLSLVGTLTVLVSFTIAVKHITKVIGETMERLLQTAVLGQAPQFAPEFLVSRTPAPSATTETAPPAGAVFTEPPLPPLEMTIQRLATDLRRQYAEQGRSCTPEEALMQARIMAADAGLV